MKGIIIAGKDCQGEIPTKLTSFRFSAVPTGNIWFKIGAWSSKHVRRGTYIDVVYFIILGGYLVIFMLMTKSVPGQADRTIRNYWCNSGTETAAATEWHQRRGKIKIGPECKLTIAFVSSPGLESVYANFMLRLHSKMLRVMHGPWSAAAQINILAKKSTRRE